MALLLAPVRRILMKPYAWPVVALSLLYLAAIALAPTSRLAAVFAASLVFLASLVAAGLALGVVPQIREREAQRAWQYLGIALGLRAAGDGFRLAIWVLSGASPQVPSMAELLLLAGFLSAVAALARYPAAPVERFGRLRDSLDVSIAVLSVLTLSWFTFIRPLFMLSVGNPIPALWSGAFVVFDLILFALATRLVLLAPRPSEVAVFRAIVFAALLLAASDLAAGYLRLEGAGERARIEAGWIAAGLLFALASVRMAAASEADRFSAGPRLVRPVARRVEPLLSVAFTYAVVGYTALDWWISGRLDWAGLAAGVILVVLLIARQGVIAGQIELRQFIALVNSSADLAFVCDQGGLIRLANPAMKSALYLGSRGPRERLGDYLVSDPPAEALLRSAVVDGWSGEVTLRRKDGTTFPASLSLRPVVDDRRSEPLLAGTAHDLTAVKARELEIRSALSEVAAARAELESLNVELEAKVAARTTELQETVTHLGRLNEELKDLDRLKSEFVTLVSHELRAPLTNIRTGIELILGANPDMESTVARSLQMVQSETRRLGEFVETILNLSALEAGKFPLDIGEVPILALAERAKARFPAHAGGGRIRLLIPDSSLSVRGDEAALVSVLFHLLDNALKYAPEGEVRVEAIQDGGEVRVEVIDEGPGIPDGQRERVFEMFHRLDARDAREVYGHGLGLHLSRRLLEAMGGQIRAESGSGGGAKFVFSLPVAEAAPAV